MKIIKVDKQTLSNKDITLRTVFKNVLLYVLIAFTVFSAFTKKSVVVVEKEIIVRDTIKELVVLKHGLTEIVVDRNKNIPNFCNNPGNLRPTNIKEIKKLAIGVIQSKNGKFLYFANEEHGFKALEILLKKVYWNKTLEQCINKYAPPTENNTQDYVAKISKNLGCSKNTLIKNLDIKKLSRNIAFIEGYDVKK